MSEILSIVSQKSLSVSQATSELGVTGERMAAEFLVSNGYRLVVSNFKVPIGRSTMGVSVTGEIDIVAIEDSILCFIEVKTRRSAAFAGPLANVDLRKQRQITRTSRVYRRIFRLNDTAYRFDVVTVLLEPQKEPQIEIVKGFWTEAKFRKKTWSGDVW